MFKNIFIIIIVGASCIYITGCTSNNTVAPTPSHKISTPYTTEDLIKAFPYRYANRYLYKKKNIMPIKHISSIPFTNGDVGRVLQTKDGFVIICGNEIEIFDVKTFRTMDEVKDYENSIK